MSATELEFLINVLTARLQNLSMHWPTNTKHLRVINKILSKIDVNDMLFTPFEKLMCRSCVVEHLPPYDTHITIDADPTSLFSLRNLSEFTEKMDMAKDLLMRFGYKKGRYIQRFDFSYRYRTTMK